MTERFWSDMDSDATADMLITCRAQYVFAWSSADEVVHVWDCMNRLQLPRLMDVEELWTRESLEKIADEYLRQEKIKTHELIFSN